MKRLLWRVFSVLLAASALAMLAFGPRPPSSRPIGRVRIQYWEKWNGLEGQQMKILVDEFNDTVGKEKGIWVDYVSISLIDRKTLVATAAGVPPDVAGLWDTQVLQFSAKNALTPLNDYAQQYGLTRDHYKHVFYDGCSYQGTLYALPSTVFSTALLWNKQVFLDRADSIRAAGLDPNRPPRTLDEFDRYAAAIDKWEVRGGKKHLVTTGYIPVETGSLAFLNVMPYWFGGTIADSSGTRMEFDSPQMIACYDWMRSYTAKLGQGAILEFRSMFSGNAQEGGSQVNSVQNPFVAGQLAMELHGPWISAFIEKLAPAMNRWHVPADQLKRESDFETVHAGMTLSQVQALLGPGEVDHGQTYRWLAGIKTVYVTFIDGRVFEKTSKLLPAKVRQQYCQWGAAPFPSALPGRENTTYAGMDVLVIPNGSKHKKEAFEFIAFVSRPEQIERLAAMHCNLSPLAKESEAYTNDHPNPYAEVFDTLAASPNARPLPRVPNWPQIFDEITQVTQSTFLEQGTTREILTKMQRRVQRELNEALDVPENRYLDDSSAAAQSSGEAK